jgi:hypothetical protein
MAGFGTTGGYYYARPGVQPTVSADRAQQIAQQWLDQNQQGSGTESADVFPGYYTIHITKDRRSLACCRSTPIQARSGTTRGTARLSLRRRSDELTDSNRRRDGSSLERVRAVYDRRAPGFESGVRSTAAARAFLERVGLIGRALCRCG